jgi:hypothetical protein
MAIDESKIQALLERADPTMKLRRLEKQLDGEEGQPGLREQLIVAVQGLESQRRLVAKRESQRELIEERALERFETNLAEVLMMETFYEGQVELMVEQIEEIEGQISELKQAGIPIHSNGNRKSRRTEKSS